MSEGDLHRTTLLIGGRWVEATSAERIDVISPFTEEVIGSIPQPTRAEADLAVAAARDALEGGPWARMAAEERAKVLERIADALSARASEAAELYTRETGVPIRVSPGLGAIAVRILRDYADLARSTRFEETRSWAGTELLVRREPVGLAAGIAPWNAPVAGLSFMLGPSLAAGCPIILKPASEAPLATHLLAEAIADADLPPGVVSVLPGDGTLGEYLVGHAAVDKIAFTGSTPVGVKIAQLAAPRMARVTLELGGKGPAVIREDADLVHAADTLTMAGMGNSGQVCCAQTRLIVHQAVHDEFVRLLIDRVAQLRVGDPMEVATDIGPLTLERQRARVESYIELGTEEGATIACGGGRPTDLDRGWFVEPTIFTDVQAGMRIAQEEIFGPVLTVLRFTDDADAVRIANDSQYGLLGSVYSADRDTAMRLARRMRVGQVHVNGYGTCPGQPFGGFKQSGVGRKGGPEGLDAFLETKVIQTHG